MTTLEATNKALTILGVAPIAIVGQVTHNGQVMGRLFEQTRKSVLADYPWQVALRRAFLTGPVITTREDWLFSFNEPTGTLWTWEVYRDDNIIVPFASEQGQILTNYREVTLEYSVDVPFDQWDATMQEAFTYKLASDAAMAVSGSEALSQAMLQKYNLYGMMAKRNTRNERNSDRVIGGKYITVRRPWSRGYWR